MEVRISHPSIDERPRILVVEPNKTNLGVMARRLVEAGYRVSTSESQTYQVRADGMLLTCEPASVLPLAQRYFLF